MQRNVNPSKFELTNFVYSAAGEASMCGVCGEAFETPLLATVFSNYSIEEYYACPQCLSKVHFIKRRETVEEEVVEAAESLETRIEAEVEKTAGCLHNLGYLKQRPKNTPIPEECLTCNKMIECMY